MSTQGEQKLSGDLMLHTVVGANGSTMYMATVKKHVCEMSQNCDIAEVVLPKFRHLQVLLVTHQIFAQFFFARRVTLIEAQELLGSFDNSLREYAARTLSKQGVVLRKVVPISNRSTD